MTPKRYIIPVFVPHLGCPNDCVFCNQNKISGAPCPANADTVREAICIGKKKIPEGAPTEIAFYGGSFTAIREDEQTALLSAAQQFISESPKNSIRLSTRPDCIDVQVLERLKAYNVKTIELGTQSMDDAVLFKSNRGHTSQDTYRAAELIKEYGFELILQMMTGLPGDTYEKSLATAKKIIGLAPTGVRIYPTVIIKATKLFDMWKAGEYKEHTVDDAVALCAKLVPMFEEAGILVIRLGLNPTEDLSGGEAVGGAYHPAFGELVYSRIYLERARDVLSRMKTSGNRAVIYVPKGKVSVMSGQKKCNKNQLMREFGLRSIKIKEYDGNIITAALE